MREIVCKMSSLIDKLDATPERGILTNFISALLRRIEAKKKEDEKFRSENISILEWMVTQLKWQSDVENQNLEEGSQGGYSDDLQKAIDLLAKLKGIPEQNQNSIETFAVSKLKHFGLWADSSFDRSEMGLERLLYACEDHKQIEILVDIPIPGIGAPGLQNWCIKHGAIKVIFTTPLNKKGK